MKQFILTAMLIIFILGSQPFMEAVPIYNAATGHYYEAIAVSGDITWTNANIAAQNQPGYSYLVTITSQEESDFIVSNFPEAMGSVGVFGYWIGARQYGEGAFVWVTGEAFDYTNWNPGEPNGTTAPNEGVHIFGYGSTPGKWNDAGVDTHAFGGYIVEYENIVPEPSTILLLCFAFLGYILNSGPKK